MKFLLLIGWIGLPLFLCAQSTDSPLSRHHWEDRVIVIFSENDQVPFYQEQIARIEESSAAFQERDLVVYKVIGEGGLAPNDQYLDIQATRELRKQFGVGLGEFACFLVGKDGGVKLRSSTPVSGTDIYRLIDSMPMRQREMRQRQP